MARRSAVRPDYDGDFRFELTELNGEIALIGYVDDVVDSVGFLTVEERGVTALHLLRKPDKLRHLAGTGPGLVLG